MTIAQRTAAIALGALLLAASAPADAERDEHDYTPIQPGALLGTPCTLNFVWRGAEGVLYVGAAAHCVGGVGSRPIAPGLGTFGTVVFSDSATAAEFYAGLPQFEYALIRVDDDKQRLVNPAMRYWGGPTGIAEEAAPGTSTLHYGQGLIYQSTEPSRARVGVLQDLREGGIWDGWWHGDYPFLGGDSGSPVLTGDGRALGFVNNLAATWGEPAAVSGPGMALVRERLHAAGFDVELVTAPFASLAEPSGVASKALALGSRCASAPVARIDSPDACVRNVYYEYHALSANDPVESWDVFPWLAMANPTATCYPLPYYPNYYVRWCEESVLVLETPGTLRLDLSWPNAADDLDLFLYDAGGSLVASSAQSAGTSETVVAPSLPAAHYRIVVVPRHAVGVENFQEAPPEGTRLAAALAALPGP